MTGGVADRLGLLSDLAARYAELLAEMERQRQVRPALLAPLARHLVRECEAARAFDWEADLLARRADTAGRAGADTAAAAARRLAGYLKAHAPVLAAAMAEASGMANAHVGASAEGDERWAAERLADLLRALAGRLDHGVDPLAAGRLHRVRVGPLIVSAPLDSRPDAPERTTILTAYLAGESRWATSGTPVRQAGESLQTTGGSPLWLPCAAFAIAALGMPDDDAGAVADTARRWVKRNPGIDVIGWHRP